MINIYNFEGNSQEDCRIKCLDNLDVYDNEIIVKEYEENDIYKMDVLKISEIKEYLLDYLNNLFKKMNIETNISIVEEEKIFTVKIQSNDNAIIIGKEGKNLSAIQVLLRQVVRNLTNFNLKINLDVSNYKLRKQQLFEQDVKKIINEVLSTKLSTKLDSMNSYQRRIVHNVANNYYNIDTESIGEEPNRYVTIKYIDE